MLRIFRKTAVASAFLLIAACSGVRPSSGDEELVRGVLVPAGERGRVVKEALLFISGREPGIFFFMEKAVRKIDTSLFYDVSHPFFDTIYLAEFALSRGHVYAASVIVHELHHIACNRIRRKGGNEDAAWTEEYMALHGLTRPVVEKMTRKAEEKTAFSIQLKFLLQYGSDNDIEYQRLRMESLDKKGMR